MAVVDITKFPLSAKGVGMFIVGLIIVGIIIFAIWYGYKMLKERSGAVTETEEDI